MAEYASLDYDISGGKRLAVTVDRGTGELQAFALDKDAVVSGTVQLVASGVERAAISVLPDSRWVSFYNIGTALYARVSEDGGNTWGAQETLPVTLIATTPGDGSYRFEIAYLPRHKLFALIYTKLVSAINRTFITALRRDNAGAWTQGAETDLGVNFQFALPVRNYILPMADGRLLIREGWFVSGFGWDSTVTVANLITNLSGPGSFSTPRYQLCLRAVELQGGVILYVGNQINRNTSAFQASSGWVSAVMWRVGGNAWNALRDSGFGIPGTGTGVPLLNYIAYAPSTQYANALQTTTGYCGSVGQLRRLRDGSAELLYHDRDGTLKFKRNRMTAYTQYPVPVTNPENFGFWRDNRLDTWE